MFLSKISKTVGIVALAVLLWFGASPISDFLGLTTYVSAAQFFVDDFEDGNIFDGNPVKWRTEGPPFDAGINAVVNGSVVLTPPDTMPPLNYVESNLTADGSSFADVSLRTRFRAQRAGAYNFGLAGRNTFQPSNGLVGTNVIGFVRYDGVLIVGANQDQVFHSLASASSGLDPAAYDVNLQFDIAGRSVAFTAWRDGTAKPAAPQIMINAIPNYVSNEGTVGMFNAQFPSPQPKIPVDVRFFQAVPEPTTVALGSLGGVALASFAFRRRLGRMRK